MEHQTLRSSLHKAAKELRNSQRNGSQQERSWKPKLDNKAVRSSAMKPDSAGKA